MKNIEKFEKFTISQKGLLIRDNKALIMEMTFNPGSWDLPGGRVDLQEDGEKAFNREIVEELGLTKFDNMGVIHYRLWYVEEEKIPVCGVVNLIKNSDDDIIISSEHLQMTWIDESEIDNYKYIWPDMAEMIKKGFERYKLLKQIYDKK